MELIVLGAAPAYTDRAGSAASSYLLRAGDGPGRSGGAALLLDLGQGAFANLASTLEPSSLTAVLVSHLHPDHFIDLVPLRHYLKWEFDPPRRVRVLAPAGLADRLDALDGQFGFAAAALDVEGLAVGIHSFGPFDVTVRRVSHTDESYAFRVSMAVPDARRQQAAMGATSRTVGNQAGAAGPESEAAGAAGPESEAAGAAGPESEAAGPAGPESEAAGPAGLVYSGDCSRVEDLVPLIRPGDTLLSEASFGAGPVAPGAQHLTSADAARAASTGRAARLLLTHMLSGRSRTDILAAAQAAFAGPVQLLTEGDRFEI